MRRKEPQSTPGRGARCDFIHHSDRSALARRGCLLTLGDSLNRIRFAAAFLRPGPLLLTSMKTGKRDRRASSSVADFGAFPFFGEAGHGIPGQSSQVRRVRSRFCLYRRRAALFLRQEIHQRPQALQAMQSKAHRRRAQGSTGDAHHLLGLRNGDDGTVQAHPGQAGSVPLLFSKAAGKTKARTCDVSRG